MARGSLAKVAPRAVSVAGRWQHQQLRRLDIHEYQAAELMGKHGINVPRGAAAASVQEAQGALKNVFPREKEIVVKSQILAGGRGLGTFNSALKRGGIASANNPISLNLRRFFSSNERHLPAISDPEIESAFKDLMAASWNEIPDSLVNEAKKAVSKATDDKAGQEALKNVFAAAEACEEFSGVLVTLRMALDDLCGLTGENVGPLPGYIEDAVKAAYNRYMTYLESFGPEENYLRKKVETELGTKMIHLKMRCSGIGSEWGKITLIGTSGISGSYIELRA